MNRWDAHQKPQVAPCRENRSAAGTCPTHPQNGQETPLAEANLQRIRLFLIALRKNAQDRGLSHQDIAAQMGLDADTVEAAFDGRIDLTLTDLQELAIAIGTPITFGVGKDD